MVPTKKRYPNIKKLAITLLMLVSKLCLYFQAYVIVVMTSYPLRQVLHRQVMVEYQAKDAKMQAYLEKVRKLLIGLKE